MTHNGGNSDLYFEVSVSCSAFSSAICALLPPHYFCFYFIFCLPGEALYLELIIRASSSSCWIFNSPARIGIVPTMLQFLNSFQWYSKRYQYFLSTGSIVKMSFTKLVQPKRFNYRLNIVFKQYGRIMRFAGFDLRPELILI
jgi:hypothetical protein